MEESNEVRQQRTIEIPARAFSERVAELSQNIPGSIYSRLALIHQVAKAFATEAVTALGITSVDLTIDELTDPPLYGAAPDDEPVVIRFSFYAD